jgi:hypothetical protein
VQCCSKDIWFCSQIESAGAFDATEAHHTPDGLSIEDLLLFQNEKVKRSRRQVAAAVFVTITDIYAAIGGLVGRNVLN